MRNHWPGWLARTGLAVPLCASALAGSATFNFDTDPSLDSNFSIGSNVSWNDPATGEQIDFYEDRDFNGKGEGGNPASGGYLAVTRAANSQYSQMLFPDFDNDLIVRAFTFDCDLRLGNATGNDGRPADGFSINYARADDPAVVFLKDNPGSSDTSRFSIPSAPEGGTTTGLSVCFDTWSGNTWPNGEADIEGIIVRVDNTTVVRYGMPTRNGACDDVTSLQTGPYDAATGGDYKGLCWAKLNVELNQAGELTVKFKGKTLLDKSPTPFAPSAGRILLAGRTGDANQNNHIDNLVITTIPAQTALLTKVTATASGITANIEDSGLSTVNPDTAGIALTVDSVAVSPLLITKVDKTTTVKWSSPAYLASGKSLAVGVSFKDSQGTQITDGRTATVAPYFLLTDDTWTAPGTGDTSKPGLKARLWQVDQLGTVGLVNYSYRVEQELAGVIGPNVADLSGATAGLFNLDLINWNQDYATAEIGNFQTTSTPSRPDVAVPGIPGTGTEAYNTDNIAGEVITYVEFPAAGMYTMGVNSDDGFKVTATDVPPANNQALVITGAASAAGSYYAVVAPTTTGKPISSPISGKLVYMDPALGCDPAVNAAALNGNVAFVDRGTCEFSAKLKNAKDAGAIAVVVVNSRTDDLATWPEGTYPIEMGVGAAGYQDIPAVMISYPDGDKIKTAIAGNLTASITPDATPVVGVFEGGRGSADTTFDILAPKAGVYPFRCVWYEGNGGANLEWFTVTASGEKLLLNDRANATALKTFRARTANPQPGKPEISFSRQGGNIVVTFTGTLETAPNVAGPWTVSTATSPLTESATDAAKYYRSKK